MLPETEICCRWSAVSSGSPLWVWPDGCRDLLLRQEPGTCPRVLLTGLDSQAYQVCAPSGTRFVGIRLLPGAMALWEREGVSAGQVDLTVLAPQGLLAERDDPDGAVGLAFLEEMVQRHFTRPTRFASDLLAAIREEVDLVRALGLSPRHLRRSSQRYTGAPPRFWQGLSRVRHAARLLLLGSDPLSTVACEAGYADQAHLCREIRRWLGQTPLGLRRARAAFVPLVLAPGAGDRVIRP